MNEQRLHGAERRLLGVAHQVHGQLDMARAGPQHGESHDAAVDLDHRGRKVRDVVIDEATKGEALLHTALVPKPIVRNSPQGWQHRRDLAALDDAETRTASFDAMHYLA